MTDNSVPSIPDTNDPNFLKAVKEALEVRLNQRGADALDASPTWRELVEKGVMALRQNGQIVTGAGGKIGSDGPVVGPNYGGGSFGFPDGGGTIDYSIITDIPIQPTNVDFNEVFGVIGISWDQTQPFVELTEIWRAQITDVLPNPTLNDAVLAGVSPFLVYTETLPQGTQYRYWLRNKSYMSVYSPWHDLNGTDVATSLDPSLILSILEGQISRTQLNTLLNTELDTVKDDIFNEIQDRILDVDTEEAARIQAIDTVQTNINTVDGRVDTVVTDVEAIQVALDTKADATVVNQQIATLESDVEGQIAAVATDLTEVSTTVNNNTSAIQQEITTRSDETGELYANWSVKAQIDVDGKTYLSGFGLASEVINNQPVSTFLVKADQFAVGSPNSNDFALTIGPVNGVQTVGIGAANIHDLAVTNAKIQDLDVNKLFAVTGTITDALIENATISTAKIANTIQSSNFVETVLEERDQDGNIIKEGVPGAGFKIWVRDENPELNGNAEFNNIVARGDIEATSIKADSVEAVRKIILGGRTLNFPVYIADRTPDVVYVLTRFITSAVWTDIAVFTYTQDAGSDLAFAKININVYFIKNSGGGNVLGFRSDGSPVLFNATDIYGDFRVLRRQPGYADVVMESTITPELRFGENGNIGHTLNWAFSDTPQPSIGGNYDVSYVPQLRFRHSNDSLPGNYFYSTTTYYDRIFELIEYANLS